MHRTTTFVLLLLLALPGASAAIDIERMLKMEPAALMQRAIAAGDTRFLATPSCDSDHIEVDVDDWRSPFLAGSPLSTDRRCRYVLGQEGMARLDKLTAYASEYNQLMLAYLRDKGLLPIYPEYAEPQTRLAPQQRQAVEQQARQMLARLVNDKHWQPDLSSFRLWRYQDGTDARLWVQAPMQASEFKRLIKRSDWQEIPIPVEARKSMHLPRNTPKSFMTCLVGHIDTIPAYLFWSEANSSLAVVAIIEPLE